MSTRGGRPVSVVEVGLVRGTMTGVTVYGGKVNVGNAWPGASVGPAPGSGVKMPVGVICA